METVQPRNASLEAEQTPSNYTTLQTHHEKKSTASMAPTCEPTGAVNILLDIQKALSTHKTKTSTITLELPMKVDILPPCGLYHPVLPYRRGGKLTIPLCRSCNQEQMPKNLLDKSHHCSHTPKQHTMQYMYLVHTRNPKSSPHGLGHHNDTRGLALPRRTMREGALCRLHGHLIKNQARICQIPFLDHNT